jgi:hypothetical protein
MMTQMVERDRGLHKKVMRAPRSPVWQRGSMGGTELRFCPYEVFSESRQRGLLLAGATRAGGKDRLPGGA